MKIKQTRGLFKKLCGSFIITAGACAGLATHSSAATVALGSAENFAVLAGSTITNTGPTTIVGNIGVHPSAAITGFPPGTVTGTIHTADAVAEQAKADATAAYTDLAGRPVFQDLTGQDLGGRTLTPGVYLLANEAQLTGTLTLDGQGLAQPLFIFQIGSTLTTASASAIATTNGAAFSNIFFQVGSSATLGTATDFKGTIIAQQSITLTTGAALEGKIFALDGAVTLDSNMILIPEPASSMLALVGLSLLCARRSRI